MYIELSSRASGKTHRLIEAIINELNIRNRIYLYAPTQRSIDIIIDKLPESLVKKSEIIVNDFSDKKLIGRKFYDEFEYIEGLKIENVGENDYFCSSPKFLRSFEHIENWKTGKQSDFLFDLLEKNGYNYSSNCSLYGKNGNLDILREAFSSAEAKNEIENYKCEFDAEFVKV